MPVGCSIEMENKQNSKCFLKCWLFCIVPLSNDVNVPDVASLIVNETQCLFNVPNGI